MRQLAAWFADGTIKPHISARFPLDRAVEALQMMAARKVTGKVVIEVP